MSSLHQQRLLALDGLRAVSILLVLVSHAWLGHIVPGGLGVTIFFFISGFIITRLMISEWDKTGTISIKKFYIRRFFRLMPALIVFVVLSLITMQLAYVNWTWTELSSVFFYFANYFGIFVGFSGEVLPPPLSITWSLAVEEHFYMIFPVFFLAVIAVPKRFYRIAICLLIGVLLWRIYLVYGVGLDNLPHYRIYKATDTRADSIVYGTCFAFLLARTEWVLKFFSQKKVILTGAALMLFSLLFRDENFRESFRYSIQGIALMCLFPVLVLNTTIASRILSTPVFVYIGRVSYSLYLYHWLVFGIITMWLPDLSFAVKFPLMIVLSFILADLSCRWVETPFLRLGRQFAH
ncbi:acyltransferase [Undibacterium sp. CY21W]|uniref:acyltransferase family protein n=1 Tax=Undibacterium sp. CY21W TaxID=2762293 RepID=UPI00164A4AA0|nr:acyltransferase [Undibacterium sp. CY21W]MBC3928578.1 acyltransferase [Undibacterium sp. CY21W]